MSLSSFIWDWFWSFFILDLFGKFAAQSNLWAVHHLNLGRFVLCCNLQRFTTFCILHICINTNSYMIWKKLNMLSVWHLFVMEIIIDYSPVPKLTFSDLSCARKLALVHHQLCALSWLSHERHCGENFHPYYFCVGWWYVITALPLYWWGSPFCIHITTTSFDIFLMHHVWKNCLMCRCWHSDVDVGVNFDVDVSFTRFDKLLERWCCCWCLSWPGLAELFDAALLGQNHLPLPPRPRAPHSSCHQVFVFQLQPGLVFVLLCLYRLDWCDYDWSRLQAGAHADDMMLMSFYDLVTWVSWWRCVYIYPSICICIVHICQDGARIGLAQHSLAFGTQQSFRLYSISPGRCLPCSTFVH